MKEKVGMRWRRDNEKIEGLSGVNGFLELRY